MDRSYFLFESERNAPCVAEWNFFLTFWYCKLNVKGLKKNVCAPFLPYHKENVKFENLSCLLVTLQIGPNQKQIVQAYLNKKHAYQVI